ncbi:hypothetical protein LZ32DRAFT_319875 [Colletotrichum eremochloae]|nr:hypothetical protein LZ32DRAFT_319875 [Colletotrichum eremochloae]
MMGLSSVHLQRMHYARHSHEGVGGKIAALRSRIKHGVRPVEMRDSSHRNPFYGLHHAVAAHSCYLDACLCFGNARLCYRPSPEG